MNSQMIFGWLQSHATRTDAYMCNWNSLDKFEPQCSGLGEIYHHNIILDAFLHTEFYMAQTKIIILSIGFHSFAFFESHAVVDY